MIFRYWRDFRFSFLKFVRIVVSIDLIGVNRIERMENNILHSYRVRSIVRMVFFFSNFPPFFQHGGAHIIFQYSKNFRFSYLNVFQIVVSIDFIGVSRIERMENNILHSYRVRSIVRNVFFSPNFSPLFRRGGAK